jgi:hypothetical protein
MDDFFYYATLFFILSQIVRNGAILAVGAIEFGRGASRRKYQGEERMHAINQLAFSAFSFAVGIILSKLLLGGTVGYLPLLLISVGTECLDLLIKYLHRKRVPSPDQLQPNPRYLPNTTAQAFLEEVELLSRKQNQEESKMDKH